MVIITVFMFVNNFAYSWRTSCSRGELCDVDIDIVDAIFNRQAEGEGVEFEKIETRLTRTLK